MLGKPMTERRRVVSLFDPGLFQFDPDTRFKYIDTRDIDALGDIDHLADPLTVFHIDPVRQEHKHLLGDDDWQAQQALVSIYTAKIDNPSGPAERTEKNGIRRLTDDTVKAIGVKTVRELAVLMDDLAHCDTGPFGPPAGYSEFENRMQLRRARLALDETTADNNTE